MDRVYTNQSTPQWDSNLPAILIYPENEVASEFAAAPRELKRVISFRVECLASGPEEPNTTGKRSVEDLLDDLCEQVECELSRDDTVGCTADDIILTGTEFQFEGDGAFPIGSARMTYEVTYHQAVPDSIDKQAGIEDLKKANVDWHVGHHDSPPDLTNIEAEDDLDIPIT